MTIYINGKLVEPNDTQEERPTTIVDRIEAGEAREFNGPVEVSNYVGQGASVKVKYGGIIVKGNVCDGATILAENEYSSFKLNHSEIFMRGNFYISVGISESGSMFNNTSVKSSYTLIGVTVIGKIGNNVTIKSDSQITISGSGNDLKAKSMNSFTSQGDIGNNAYLHAGNSLNVSGSVGRKSTLKSGNSTTVGNVGADSSLESGNSINAGILSERVTARAGNSLTAAHIGERVQISAGNKVTASVAHVSAQISAGNKARIVSYVGQRGGSGGTTNRDASPP
jgi:hypothetical protein